MLLSYLYIHLYINKCYLFIYLLTVNDMLVCIYLFTVNDMLVCIYLFIYLFTYCEWHACLYLFIYCEWHACLYLFIYFLEGDGTAPQWTQPWTRKEERTRNGQSRFPVAIISTTVALNGASGLECTGVQIRSTVTIIYSGSWPSDPENGDH